VNSIAVSVTHQSSTVTYDEVAAIIPRLQTQVSEHLGPVWRIDAALTLVPEGGQPRSIKFGNAAPVNNGNDFYVVA
jgi:hypothetical protein